MDEQSLENKNFLQNKTIILITAVLFFFIFLLLTYLLFPKKQSIKIAELKDDLSDNYLNYIDKPSWMTSQALKLIIPPLIDYQYDCYPTSKLLKSIPTKDNKQMFLEDGKTVIIFPKSNFINIDPNNIIPTIQLLNMDNISNKWVYVNLVETIDKIEMFNNGDIKIKYKTCYSLPYFPCPVIFDNPEKFQDQIVNYTFKEIKNFNQFPKYSDYVVKKAENNNFILSKNNKEIRFITFTNVEKLKKEVNKFDLIKIPSNLKDYFSKELSTEYQVITLPNREIFFIFFNPNLSKQERVIIYEKLVSKISKYSLKDYQINKTYILPYHFACLKQEDESKDKENINTSKINRKIKVLIAYKDEKSKLFSNLLEDILTKDLQAEILKTNIERDLPKKEIFGGLIEPPEPSIKASVNPINFDFIITSITFLPYMDYYSVYSKNGKYNVYSVSNTKIEELLGSIMQGFSFEQKDLLIELQKELNDEFLIVPFAIDTQTFIIKKEKMNVLKINSLGINFD